MFNNVMKPQKPVTFGGTAGLYFDFYDPDVIYDNWVQGSYDAGTKFVLSHYHLFVAQNSGSTGATEPTWDTSEIGAQTVDGDVIWEYRPLDEVYDPITISVPAGVDGATAVHVTVLEVTYDCFSIEIELNDGTIIVSDLDSSMYPREINYSGGGLGYFAQGGSPDKLIKSVTISLDGDSSYITDGMWVKGRVYFSTRGGTPAGAGFTSSSSSY